MTTTTPGGVDVFSSGDKCAAQSFQSHNGIVEIESVGATVYRANFDLCNPEEIASRLNNVYDAIFINGSVSPDQNAAESCINVDVINKDINDAVDQIIPEDLTFRQSFESINENLGALDPDIVDQLQLRNAKVCHVYLLL